VRVSTMTNDTPDADDSTLHGCAASGNLPGLQNLLNAVSVPDVNARDEHGFAPLHLAADRGHAPIVQLLLRYGADASIEDPDGETAASLAEVAGHQDVLKILTE